LDRALNEVGLILSARGGLVDGQAREARSFFRLEPAYSYLYFDWEAPIFTEGL